MDVEAIEFPSSRGSCPFTPPAALSGIHRDNPVCRVRLGDGSHSWLVTRNADVRAVLRDKRFSSSTHHDGFPWVNEGLKAQSANDPQPFIRLDGQEHRRIRNRLLADFTPLRGESLRSRIQEIVDDCLDRMIEHGSPADLVAELALPLPSLIICEMLGVDPVDRQFFQSRSALLTQTFGRLNSFNRHSTSLSATWIDSRDASARSRTTPS
jgi:cytochrome P450